mmetsp:Transcript_6512/g.5799  ORF Transcript_6512/g.5799 Transcript_6512/m.5799 type:complete len:216 (-) Transcript_6512:284-931(-)
MEAEAHLHAVVGHPLVEFLVLSVPAQLVTHPDGGHDLHERQHRHVTELLHPVLVSPQRNLIFDLVIVHIVLIELPHKEEGISDVLVGGPVVAVHDAMDDLSDFVHKDHHFGLEDLSGVGEVSDVAEAEDRHDFLAREHRVHIATALHVLGNDLGASLSEAQSQQGADLDDGLLEQFGLHDLPLLLLFSLLAPVLLPLPLLLLLLDQRLILLLLGS